MLITDKKMNMKELDDVLTEHREYHQMQLGCCLTGLSCDQNKIQSGSAREGNVITFPESYHDYVIRISGEAFNCFENHSINIYVTFNQDRQAWEKYASRIQHLIDCQKAVLVSSDVYNIRDDEINFYDPTIILSTD
jgi:hypothetical protein